MSWADKRPDNMKTNTVNMRGIVSQSQSHSAPPRKSRPAVKRSISRFAVFVETTLANWTEEERTLAQTQIGQLLERIGAGQSPKGEPPREGAEAASNFSE
jgi:hypothetical protein